MPFFVLISFLTVSINKRPFIYIFAIAVGIIFSAHNYFRVPSSDWAWYVRHYGYIMDNGIQPYLALANRPHADLHTLLGVRPAITEPIFYIYMYVAGLLIGPNVAVFGFVTSFIFYITISISTIILARKFNLTNLSTIVVLVFALTLTTNYTIVLHLIRQELVAAFIILAVSLFINRNFLAAAIFCLVSIMTHNSAAIPIAVIVFVAALLRQTRSPLIHSAVYLVASAGFVSVMTSTGRVDFVKNDGGIGLLTYLLDLSVFVIYATCIFLNKKRNEKLHYIDGVTVYATCFFGLILLASSSVSLLFLRLYFYTDIFVLFAFVRSVCIINTRRSMPFYMPYVLLFFGFVYILLSIDRSPLLYSMPIERVLFWPIVW